MAKRKFILPGIHELNKDQEDALYLPKEGQHLIIGGPGTGKSVLALLRSRRHHNDKEEYLFLVYNHLLHQASRHLFGMELTSNTWQNWFRNKFSKWTGQSVPCMPAAAGKSWGDIDWEQALCIIREMDLTKLSEKFPFLIIDEGQDMPPEFYQALIDLGFDNFYVVADQNQQIISGKNSSRQDIENALGISRGDDGGGATKDDDVIELTMNYRNSYPTARLALEFYTNDPASPPPVLPPIKKTAKTPLLVEYGNNARYKFASVIHAILKTADRDPGKLIGIIAPNNEARKRYVQELSQANPKLDNGKPKIQTYASGENATKVAYDEGGIMVINAQSCKGLEFDIVILADIDRHYCHPGIMDEKKRLFYVMVSRAKENVIILKNADNYCPADAIIPNNPDILEMRR